MGYNCLNHKDPAVNKFMNLFSAKLNISKEDLIGNGHYLNASGISPTIENAKVYEEFFKYVFFIDPDNAVFFNKEDIENTYNEDGRKLTVKEFKQKIEAFKTLVGSYNSSANPSIDQLNAIKATAQRLSIPFKTYKDSKGKLQIAIKNAVIQEKARDKNYTAKKQAAKEKRNKIFAGQTQLDIIHRTLNLAMQLFGTEVIESPNFAEDHTYYRIANKNEHDSSQAITYNGKKWVPVDGSVTQLSAENIIIKKEGSPDAVKALMFGNANDMVMRAVFMAEAAHSKEDREDAKRILAGYLKNGISTKDAAMSKEAVADTREKALKIIKQFDVLYGKNKWRAWAHSAPIISKLVKKEGNSLTTMYIAGEFDLLIYDSEGKIHPYDFKTSKTKNRIEENIIKREQYELQLARYVAMLDTNPLLSGKMDTRASVIQTLLDYTRNSESPVVKDINVVEFESLSKQSASFENIAFLGLDEAVLLDQKTGIIYNKRNSSFKSLLQRQRDVLNNSRDILSTREKLQAARFIGKKVILKIQEYLNRLKEEDKNFEGNEATVLRDYRNAILREVFEENFSTNENTDALYKNKRNLIYNNSTAILEYTENYFRKVTGMSLFFDYREISDKEQDAFMENENTDLGINEENRVDDLWKLGDANRQSPNLTLSKSLRKEFALMEERREGREVLDAFGNKSYVDEVTAFNELRKILSEVFTIDDMIAAIKGLDDTVPYKEALLAKLNDKSGNSAFRSAFFNGFKMQSITYSAVKLIRAEDGTFEYRVYRVNTSPVQAEMLNNMRQMFGENPSMVNHLRENIDGYIEDLRAVQNKKSKREEDVADKIDLISEILESLGIGSNIIGDSNIKQALYMLNDRNGYKKGLNLLVSNLIGSRGNPNGLLQLLREQFNKDSLYNPFSVKDNPIVKKITAVALTIAPNIKESVELTAYENGKTYYSYSNPSYLSNLCEAVSSDRYLDYIKEEYGNYRYFYNSEDGSYRSEWLNEIAKGEILERKIQLNFNKTEYEDLGEGAYALSLLAEYVADHTDYGWYAVPTLSNKSTSEFLKFLKYDIEEINEKIQKVFEQELIQILEAFQYAEAGKNEIENYSLPVSKQKWAKEILEKYKNHELTVKDISQLLKRKRQAASFGFLSFLNNTNDEKLLSFIAEYLNSEGTEEPDSKLLSNVSDAFKAEMNLRFEEYKNNLRKLGVFSTDEIIPYRTSKKDSENEKISVPRFLVGLLDTSVKQIIEQHKGERRAAKAVENQINEEVDYMLKDYFWNSVFANINIIQLTSTSTSFYKNMEEFQKRNAQIHGPKQMLDKNAFWNVDGAMQKVFDEKGLMRTIVLDDEVLEAEIKDFVVSNFNSQLKDLDPTSAEYAYLTNLKNSVISILDKVTTTDGQAYNSPTSNRKKTIGEGLWSDEDEEVYQHLIKGEPYENPTKWQVKKPLVYGSIKGDFIRIMQQFKNSENVLVLMDAFSRESGGKFNRLAAIYDFMENTAYKGRTVVRDGFEYKDGVKGERSDKPDGTIINVGTYTGTGIDTVLFKSNVKHSVRTPININGFSKYDDILSTLYKYAFNGTEYDPEYVNIMDFDSYGIQQPVPAHYTDNNALIGSQMRILAVSGISPGTVFNRKDLPLRIGENGKFLNSYEDLINEYQDLQATGIEDSVKALQRELLLDEDAIKDIFKSVVRQTLKKNKVRGNETAFEYFAQAVNSLVAKKVIGSEQRIQLTKSASDLLKKEMFTYANLVKDNPFIESTISQQTKDSVLSELLKESVLKDSKFGVDLLEAFELNEDGEFKVPLGESMHSIKVQQLLNSIIRDRIWKQKAPGGPIVQVSGYDNNLRIIYKDAKGKIALTKEEFEKAQNTSEYSSYNSYEDYLSKNKFRLSHYETIAPIPSEELEKAFIEAGKRNGVNYFLHPELAVKHGIISEEMLKLIGYRIPTEDKYSIVPMKIVGFFPKQAGEGIVLPKDITAIAGLDFDVDKLYVIRKHFFSKTASDSIDKKSAISFLVDAINSDPEYKDLSNTKKASIASITLSKVIERLKKEEIEENTLEDDEDNPAEASKEEDKTIAPTEEYSKLELSLYEDINDNPDNYKGQRKFKHVGYNINKFEQIKRSKAKRQNRIFDIQWAILTSREASEQMFNPQSFDNLVKVGYVITILENGGIKKDDGTFYSYKELMQMPSDFLESRVESSVGHIIYPQTTMYFQHANTVANSMVGIFANQNISHAFVSLPGIDIFYNPSHEFTLGGISVTSGKTGTRLDPLKSFNGAYVNKNIAAFLAAAVDAAKKNALAPIGINKSTVNVAGLLLRLGFDPEIVSLFISQPIIKEVAKKVDELSIMGYTTFQKAVAEVLDEHKKKDTYDQLSMTNNPDSYNDSNLFSYENLSEEIQNSQNDVTSDNQLRVLNLFSSLLEDAKSLENITFATKFNSRSNSTGPTLADTIVLMRKYDNYKNMISSSKDKSTFKGTDVLASSRLLRAFYDSSIGDNGLIKSIFNQYFPHLSSPIISEDKEASPGIIDIIADMSTELNAKDINKIMSHLMYYALTDSDLALKSPEEWRLQIFDTSREHLFDLLTSFPKEALSIKERYKNNLAARALIINRENDKAKFPIVEMRTSQYKEQIEDLKADWEELHQREPEFSKKLIEYMLLVNGFGYSPKTSLHNTPLMVKFSIDNNLVSGAYINAIRKLTTQPEEYLKNYSMDFIYQFFRNNSSNRKFVTKIVKPKDLHFAINYSKGSISPANNMSWEKYISHYGTPPVWILYKDTLYYNENYNDSEKDPNYVSYSPLGISDTLVEYNASEDASEQESVVKDVQAYFLKHSEDVVSQEDSEEVNEEGDSDFSDDDSTITKSQEYLDLLIPSTNIVSVKRVMDRLRAVRNEQEFNSISKIIDYVLSRFEEEDAIKINEERNKKKEELNLCK